MNENKWQFASHNLQWVYMPLREKKNNQIFKKSEKTDTQWHQGPVVDSCLHSRVGISRSPK